MIRFIAFTIGIVFLPATLIIGYALAQTKTTKSVECYKIDNEPRYYMCETPRAEVVCCHKMGDTWLTTKETCMQLFEKDPGISMSRPLPNGECLKS